MTETEAFLINCGLCVLAGIGGFLIRLTLESWRDYHVAKALHEAKLEDTNVIRRYKHAKHRKRMIPSNILTKFMDELKSKKRAIVVCESGRWRNAA